MTAAGNAAATLPRDRPVVVTGAAGFIGFHFAARLLDAGVPVVGLDNVNDYYDTRLKRARLADLAGRAGFTFVEGDLDDRAAVERAVTPDIDVVVHLGAQAGVRYSLENPRAYGASNLTGFLNVLEACREAGVGHLLYASSSSVYGGNTRLPFSAADGVDHPVSLYAATKRANELMAHTYGHLFGLPATGLRFFTVYGPWGRPDMAYWLFTDAISAGRPIKVFNNGAMKRDFTYVDDIVEAMVRLIPNPPAADPSVDRATLDPSRSWAPHRVFNIGNDRPEALTYLIEVIERAVGREAIKELRPMPPGDVPATWADVAPLEAAIGWRPTTPLDVGIGRFVDWFKDWSARA